VASNDDGTPQAALRQAHRALTAARKDVDRALAVIQAALAQYGKRP
jgi:hypothetical protein